MICLSSPHSPFPASSEQRCARFRGGTNMTINTRRTANPTDDSDYANDPIDGIKRPNPPIASANFPQVLGAGIVEVHYRSVKKNHHECNAARENWTRRRAIELPATRQDTRTSTGPR